MNPDKAGYALDVLETCGNTLEEVPDQGSRVVTPSNKVPLEKRVSRQSRKKENKLCLDCSRPSPKWITILSIPPPYVTNIDHHHDTFLVGGFCCLECSGAHRRLGTHISFVRSIELDSIKENEVRALECGGNERINRIFEGKLLDTSVVDDSVKVSFSKEAKPDQNSSQKRREAFIHNKYEKKLYVDIKEMSKFRQSMIGKGSKGVDEGAGMDVNPSPQSSTSSASPSPMKLQVFTSSPRTLALIEKYMNPKPKKKNIGSMIKNTLRRRGSRFSRKQYFKKSLRQLRGVVGVNPSVNVVETRSEDFGESDIDSDCDVDFSEEVQSISSTRSSMSAFFRRSCMVGKRVRRYQHISKSLRTASTPNKVERKRTRLKIKRKRNKKKNGGNKEEEFSEEELEVFDLKDDSVPTTPKSSKSKSPRFRLTPYLRTPKRKNVAITINPTDNVASPVPGEADDCCSTLEIVTERGDGNSDDGKPSKEEDIKAFQAWSSSFEKVMKMRGRKNQKSTTFDAMDGRITDEEEFLRANTM